MLPLLAGGVQAVGAVSDGSETIPIDPVETGVSFEADGIYYKIIDETKLYLSTVEGPVKYSGKVVIPDEVKYEGKDWKVTKVSGFLKCPDVTEITIPRYVTTISGFYGSYGYWDSKPGIKSPKRRAEGAQESKLRTVHFNAENCEKAYYKYHKTGMMGGGTYGEQAAFPSTVVNVDFGENVTKVPVGLFVYCSGIKKVVFPESVTEIGALFIDKDYDNVEKCEILSRDLQVCDWLPNNYSAVTLGPEFHTYPYSDSGVRYGAEHVGLYTPYTDKPYVFHKYMGYDPETTSKLEFPAWVRNVAPNAFSSFKVLTEISLDGLEEIGKRAFYGSEFEALTISSTGSLTVGEDAIRAKKLVFNVRELTLNGSLGPTEVELNCEKLDFPKGNFYNAERCVYNVGNATHGQGWWLFSRNLTEVEFGEKVKTIPNWVFNQSRLKSLSIPSHVENIESGAFVPYKEISTLEEVYFDCNLIAQESLWMLPFPSVLKRVTIGPNCRVIPSRMFAKCSLETIDIPGTVEVLSSDAFSETTLRTVNCNMKKVNFSAFDKCESLDTFILGENVEEVSGQMMGTNVERLDIHRNLIGDVSIPTLKIATFSKDVTKIPNRFLKDSPLEVITFDGEIEELGEDCFASSRLEKIVLPETLKKYRYSYGFDNATEVEINSKDCDFVYLEIEGEKIKSITIGENVMYNPPLDFLGFSGATLYYNARRMERKEDDNRVIFNSTQNVFGDVIIGENVEYIPEDFMRYNINLKEIVLPRSVKEIGYGAFNGCDGMLRVVSAPFVPPLMTKFEFYTDVNFSEVVYATATLCVPKGCAESYRKAEGWKNFKNIIELASLGENGIEGVEVESPGFRIDGNSLEVFDEGITVYDMAGKVVQTDRGRAVLSGGVYIVRYRSGRVEKVVAPGR